jgi:hypothetical protein
MSDNYGGMVLNKGQTGNSPEALLNRYAVFDKVINAQFIRRDKTVDGGTFTIRSDYEIAYNIDGSYSFAKTNIKPELKIHYLQVNNNTAIQVKLFVTNLHIHSETDAVSTAFSSKGNPIEFVKVQLGYFNQFPNFLDETQRLTDEDYFNLAESKNSDGYKQITCRVLAVYPSKLPPDGITVFDCVVGSFDQSFHSVQGKDDKSVSFTSSTAIKDFLFETITRRFPRSYILPTDVELDTKLAKTVLVDGKKTYFPGPMTVKYAKNNGVLCYLSPKVSEYSFKELGDGAVVPAIEQRQDVNAAFHTITNTFFKNLRTFAMPDGNYLLYDASEILDDVAKSDDFPKSIREVMTIPSIYSITYSGIRTITCPFMTLVNPFQLLEFSSRYNLANLVGYFYTPGEGRDTFFAINCSVTFSTTGDENEMVIASADAAKEGA